MKRTKLAWKFGPLLVIGILLATGLPLSVLVSETPAFADGTTTWYVDDDGGADFTLIHEAVEAASEGDTIIVYAGVYLENMDVDRSLIIQSQEGAGSTVVQATDSEDHVFEVTADHVTIEGFMITGATAPACAGIHLNYGLRCTVFGNIVTNNYHGISLASSSNNTLENNMVNSNNQHGISLSFSNGNTLIGNAANSNGSIGIDLAYSNSNTLLENAVSSNVYTGIRLLNSNVNELVHNTINSNNTMNHLHHAGLNLISSSSNTVYGNTANSNKRQDIRLDSSSSNTIYLNSFGRFSSSYSTNTWSSPQKMTYTYNGNDYENHLGNYWSNYTGMDVDPEDGIGDTPYPIGGDQDSYPLMNPLTPGDADWDGDVDVFDWVKVRRILEGLDDPTPGADADGDGDVDVFDWVKVRRILEGLD